MRTAPLSALASRFSQGDLYKTAIVGIVGLLAAAFVAAHVPFVSQTLDGIDSANFTLAVDRYDPRLHQPHPPGFPVHVALGRLVNSTYRMLVPDAAAMEAAATSLRMWSVFSGGLAVVSITWVALGLGVSAWRAFLVAAFAATCPLFWITAMRPLSDVPGLLFAVLAQALTLAAYNHGLARTRIETASEMRQWWARLQYRWLAAALVAGVAVGVRVQTALLTAPLLALLTVLHARRAGPAVVLQVIGAFTVGVLAWAVPMIATLGGPSEYLRLLTTVAVDDVQGVEMFATHPTPRLLALALVRTFIVPWRSPVLGWVALALAGCGAVALARYRPRALVFVSVMALPYLIFHVALQDTSSIRYALPLLPVSCILIVANLKWRRTRLIATIASIMLIAAAALSATAAGAYGRSESPVARAIHDLGREVSSRPTPPTLGFHHSVARAIRGEGWSGRVLPAPVRYEWLELANNWLAGDHREVWFLADARRSDLALIDPAARRLVRSYRWPSIAAPLLGGIQPSGLDWYEIASPGWFLMKGWALTPEALGVSIRDHQGPGVDGAVGHVKRRTTPAVMMIGGRNLGGPSETGASIEVAIDGRARATWVTQPAAGFLQTIVLPAGELQGDGDYATVKVTARDVANTARIVHVAVEQFDLQSPGSVMAGFDRGWHMPELNPSTGLSWRWIEERAALRLETFGRNAELVIRGESPLRYFQTPPRVQVRVGQVELASFTPTADFEWIIPVPATTLTADSRVTIDSNQSFVPHEVSGNGDHRRLALRIYSVEIRPR